MVSATLTDHFISNQRALPASREGRAMAVDLPDMRANAERCGGLAANMIGGNQRIVAVSAAGWMVPMLGPPIAAISREIYEVEEGFLPLSGVEKAVLHPCIDVFFQDMPLQWRRQTYSGLTAQTSQYKPDHCKGILI